jgi:hypothetical protein
VGVKAALKIVAEMAVVVKWVAFIRGQTVVMFEHLLRVVFHPAAVTTHEPRDQATL